MSVLAFASALVAANPGVEYAPIKDAYKASKLCEEEKWDISDCIYAWNRCTDMEEHASFAPEDCLRGRAKAARHVKDEDLNWYTSDDARDDENADGFRAKFNKHFAKCWDEVTLHYLQEDIPSIPGSLAAPEIKGCIRNLARKTQEEKEALERWLKGS